jgi:hypothetical protein
MYAKGDDTPYFAMAVSYTHKMFNKLTTGGDLIQFFIIFTDRGAK